MSAIRTRRLLPVLLLPWLVAPGLACGAGEAPSERPVAAAPAIPRPAMVRDYRRSGDYAYWDAARKAGRKRRWTPAEVVDLLAQHPAYYVDMGIWGGRPPGHRDHREVGRVVNEAQAIAAQRGIDTARLSFHFRPDVYSKHRPGHPACAPACGWGGTMTSPPFDPAFVVKVPRSEHRWAIEHRWDGDLRKDPFGPDADDSWPAWLDREAFSALNDADGVAALYGKPYDADRSELGEDWKFRVSAVVMDLRNPAYRAWSVARVIASLKVMGIDPGESATLVLTYKPGWHAYYEGGRSVRQNCFVPEGRAWTGPSGRCLGLRRFDGGLFHRTSYGPGEFETAINAMLRELRAGLVAAGLGGVGIMTTERPDFRGEPWSLLAPDVRRAPWLIGEWGGSCHRLDPRARPDPIRCR